MHLSQYRHEPFRRYHQYLKTGSGFHKIQLADHLLPMAEEMNGTDKHKLAVEARWPETELY